MDEFIILWFNDYWSDALIAKCCHYSDLENGYVTIHFYDRENNRDYTVERKISDGVDITHFKFLESERSELMLKWEDRNKLFEKYPELEKLAS